MANDEKLTFRKVKERMDKFYATALLTKEETAGLNKGLKNNMPKDWDEKNIFARIKAADIILHSDKPGWQIELLKTQWENDGWFAVMCKKRLEKIKNLKLP